MQRLFHFYLFIVLLMTASCSGLSSRAFTSEHIVPGMSKEQVVLKFGKPDRESFMKGDDNILYESLYYTKFERRGVVAYYDYILDFKNGSLVAMRQEPQIPPTEKVVTIKTD